VNWGLDEARAILTCGPTLAVVAVFALPGLGALAAREIVRDTMDPESTEGLRGGMTCLVAIAIGLLALTLSFVIAPGVLLSSCAVISIAGLAGRRFRQK
jgi:O-antigen/teichoic acid export membrane protein